MRETLLANVAFVLPFARVRPQMGLDAAEMVERLAAKVALKDLHSVLPPFSVWMRLDSAALVPSGRTAGTDGR